MRISEALKSRDVFFVGGMIIAVMLFVWRQNQAGTTPRLEHDTDEQLDAQFDDRGLEITLHHSASFVDLQAAGNGLGADRKNGAGGSPQSASFVDLRQAVVRASTV